jgi:mono/diheme cytochrome c family protein
LVGVCLIAAMSLTPRALPKRAPATSIRRPARFGLWLIAALGGCLPLQAAGAPPVGGGEPSLQQPGDAGRPSAEPDLTTPGTSAEGERLALRHCGRCHVVNDKNRFGGIGSTPSFGALRALPGANDKFAAFWTLNPHPAFVQVEGQTTPFDPAHPPSTAPVVLTREEAEAIASFAASIKPLDLGAPVRPR